MVVSSLNPIETSSFNSKWISTKLSKITVNKGPEKPKLWVLEQVALLARTILEAVEVDKDNSTPNKIWVHWVLNDKIEAVSILQLYKLLLSYLCSNEFFDVKNI